MAGKTKRLDKTFVGSAGVFHVASELSMRGLIALPTIKNTRGIDILVTDPETGAHAILQVKTSQDCVSFWPTSKPENCPAGRDTFFVFVRRLVGCHRFEAFVVRASRVVDDVRRVVSGQKARGRSVFPCWYLPKDEANALRSAWSDWRPAIDSPCT